MSSAPDMAERLMVDQDHAGDYARMDEATIDCARCGGPGWLECRVEVLADNADWRMIYQYVVCERHRNHLAINFDMLDQISRVILQRCG